MEKMKAIVLRGINDLRIEDVPKPHPGAGEAVIRIGATTICGTDVHIVKGEYPVHQGLILGHDSVERGADSASAVVGASGRARGAD